MTTLPRLDWKVREALQRLERTPPDGMSAGTWMKFYEPDVRAVLYAVPPSQFAQHFGFSREAVAKAADLLSIRLLPDVKADVTAAPAPVAAPAPPRPPTRPRPAPASDARPRSNWGGTGYAEGTVPRIGELDWDSPRLKECLQEYRESSAKTEDLAAKYGVSVRALRAAAKHRGISREQVQPGGHPRAPKAEEPPTPKPKATPKPAAPAKASRSRRASWSSPERQELLRRYRDETTPSEALAAEYGVKLATLRVQASKFGVRREALAARPPSERKTPRGGTHPSRITPEQRDEAVKLYRESDLDPKEIAARIGNSVGGVKSIMAKLGVRREHPDRRKRPWTQDEEATLRREWHALPHDPRRIGKMLDRSRVSVQNQVAKMGLPPIQRNPPHHWTKADYDLLRREYDGTSASCDRLADLIGSTPQGVKTKAKALKLAGETYARKRHRWTSEDRDLIRREYEGRSGDAARIAKLLGVEPKAVQRQAYVLGVTGQQIKGERAKPRPWTDEELSIIRRHWDNTHAGAEKIAKWIKRSYSQVQHQAYAMGLYKRTDRRRREWTEEEDARLRDLLQRYSVATIANKLDCSVSAVVNRVKRLGLSRRSREGWFTKSEVMEIIGEDHRWVQKRIDSGALKASWHHGKEPSGPGLSIWHIAEADLAAWLIGHADEINGRNVDLPTIVRLVAEYSAAQGGRTVELSYRSESAASVK